MGVGIRPATPSLLDFVDEVVFGFFFVAGFQFHLATRILVFAGAAGDRQLRWFATVVERPLHGHLPTGEGDRPDALPGLAHGGANALAVVGAFIRLVGRVVDRIGESEHVADRVFLAGRADVLDG